MINSRHPNAKFLTQTHAIGTKGAIETEIIEIGTEIGLAITIVQLHQVETEKETEIGTIEKEVIAARTLFSKEDIITHLRDRRSEKGTPKGLCRANARKMKLGEVDQGSALMIEIKVGKKVVLECVVKMVIMEAKTR